jgi:hypothetical protein
MISAIFYGTDNSNFVGDTTGFAKDGETTIYGIASILKNSLISVVQF